MPNTQQKITIYQSSDGQIQLEIKLEQDTLWLSQAQMAELFQVKPQNITMHLQRVFSEGELDAKATCKDFLQVQVEGKREVKRKRKLYNLDAIISVGYRVNSARATQFRIWATHTLKEHLVAGFTINQQRLQHNQQKFDEALNNIQALAEDNQQISKSDVLELIRNFSHTWFSLDQYDKQLFPREGSRQSVAVTAEQLLDDIHKLKTNLIAKGEASELFAQEKMPGAFSGILGNVFQSVFGEDVYPSIEQKAAHLLYFIVKNHPFTDGNKRSGAFAFIWLLEQSSYPFKKTISPETLTTLTILVAESQPTQKDKIIGLILLLFHK